ncbi:MAG TPA: hypothetical protein VN258_20930 [Mobilitalea sp.]|nr:hypothetical protein [Mobilitalea sp.]
MKELILRHMGNAHDRTAATSLAAFTVNAMIGVGKLILGIYLLSAWFVTNSIYYLVLCFVRGHSIQKYTYARSLESSKERYDMEFTVYKRSGIFVCLLGISYLLVCLRMYLVGDSTVYKGNIVYLVATIAFTKMGFAIHGTVANRHLKDPIIATLKIISFIDAMVSIVVTQCTLLTMEASLYAVKSSALFGMGCSILFILIGSFMLMKKKKYPLQDKLESIKIIGERYPEEQERLLGK